MIFRFHSYNENVQQARSILASVKKDENNTTYKKIRKLLSGQEGYVGFFTKMHFVNKVSFRDLVELKNIIDQQNNIIRSLPKNLIEYNDYEELIDDIEKAKIKAAVRKIYNEFPSEQKQYIDINDSDDSSLLYKLYQRKDSNNFLRKISAYHSKAALITRLKSFINSNSEESFSRILSNIKSVDAEIIHQSMADNIIVCRIRKYNQCRSLGADTSWCIVRSDSTFYGYVPDELSHQYIIYLTDRANTDINRKIGATFNVSGYRTAHNVNDGYVSYETLKSILKEYEYDINNLMVKKSEIKDLNPHSVDSLLKIGFNIDEILVGKKSYNVEDLKYIPKELIISNNIINEININACTVERLLATGKFTLDEICQYKSIFTAKDLEKLNRDLIDKYDLINTKSEIPPNIFRTYSGSEIEEKGLLKRVPDGSLYLTDIIHISPRIVKSNEELILKKLSNNKAYKNRGTGRNKPSEKEIFIEYIMKPNDKIDSLHDYVIGSKWNDNFKYSLELTIYNLRFHLIGPNDYSFKELINSGVFSDISIRDLNKVKSFLDGAGYKYTDDEITNYFNKISYHPSFDTRVPFYSELINMGIDCKKEFLSYITKHDTAWSSWDLKKIESCFKKDELELFYEKDRKGNFRKEVLNVSKYASIPTIATMKPAPTPLEFYNKWNNFIQISEIPAAYGSNAIRIGVIAIYAKLGKLEEISNVSFPWKSKEFVHELAKYICGVWYYNSKPTIGLELTEDQKESIYTWISRNFMTPILYDLEDPMNPTRPKDYQLQALYYLYDKESFEEYVDRCKQVKDNDYYETKNGRKTYYTLRIKNLTAVIKYLEKMEKYDDIKSIVSKVLSWKMSDKEAQHTKNWLFEKLHGSSNYTSDIKIYNDNFKEMVENFRPDITNYKPDKYRNSW